MTVPECIVIIGGSGGSKIALDIFGLLGCRVLGFMNNFVPPDGWSQVAPNLLGSFETRSNRDLLRRNDVGYFVATGDNHERKRLLGKLAVIAGKPAENAIHPTAIISPLAEIGKGNLINARAVINALATIGNGTIINTGAIIEHDCRVGDYSQISPGSVLAGYVHVYEFAFIGTGASIIPHITVGNGAVVAAGAVVIRHVERGELVAGVPAVHKKKVDNA